MKKFIATLAVVGALAAMTPVFAHHAANAEFDLTKVYKIKGTLMKAELINPHSYLKFKAVGPGDSAQTEWDLETVTPIAMKRAGIVAREALKQGESYEFTMSPARDGSHVGFLHSITLLDGRRISLTAAANAEGAGVSDASAPK